MGGSNSAPRLRLWGWPFTSEQKLRVLQVGLDAAGKTTILYKIKKFEFVTPIRKVGFGTVEHLGMNIMSWDVGGNDKIRPLWRHYFQGTQALVFVVDSNDRDRIDDASAELQTFIMEDELRDAILLVFANKQDMPNAMPVQMVSEKLGLHAIRDRRCFIQGSCALTGYGLREGYDWIVASLTDHPGPSPLFDYVPGPRDITIVLSAVAHEDDLRVSCCNVGGAELVLVQVEDPGQYTVGDLRAELSTLLALDTNTLRLLSPSGQPLPKTDDATSVKDMLDDSGPDHGSQVDTANRCQLRSCVIA